MGKKMEPLTSFENLCCGIWMWRATADRWRGDLYMDVTDLSSSNFFFVVFVLRTMNLTQKFLQKEMLVVWSRYLDITFHRKHIAIFIWRIVFGGLRFWCLCFVNRSRWRFGALMSFRYKRKLRIICFSHLSAMWNSTWPTFLPDIIMLWHSCWEWRTMIFSHSVRSTQSDRREKQPYC